LAIIEKNYQLKQTLACPHLGRYNVFQALRGHAEHPLIAQFVVRGLADHEANRVIP
jgi:aminopeptidase-like protein